MPELMLDSIFGVETEFGTLVADESLGLPEDAVEAIKSYVFSELKLGLVDLHARDEVFEPARSGGFLINGGRLYIDAVGSHLEYATAECRSLKDLVANDRAGQRIVLRAISDLGLSGLVDVYSNAIDHFGGHTFGCHENYLVAADGELFDEGLHDLYPFLVTRQIFAGIGRVGGHRLFAGGLHPSYEEVSENPIDYLWVSNVYSVEPDETVDFQLSQRADHILKTVASRVRFNRAIVNPKWEQFYSSGGMTRLHILFGEANQNPFSYALKVGTTVLVLRLIQDGIAPNMRLSNPVRALRDVSRDPDFEWVVERIDGSTIGAIDLQRQYLEAALKYRGISDQWDWVLAEWEAVLDGLEKNPMNLGDRIDWVAKRKIVEMYMASEGLQWGDDSLHSIDLEYHNIDPARSLYHAWAETNGVAQYLGEASILKSMADPPADTRAFGRAKLISHALKRRGPKKYLFDWNFAMVDGNHALDLTDPFDTYGDLADELISLS